eukprot:Skav203358  [mRNA]  locus=scaffold1076:540282:548940:+ [translate_table: standard]
MYASPTLSVPLQDVPRASNLQPAPPPPPSETATVAERKVGPVADPSFTLALKRASQSASAMASAPPALGHRRWSKSSSPEELPAERDANLAAERTVSKEVASGPLQRGFSDLALSFASLDETM